MITSFGAPNDGTVPKNAGASMPSGGGGRLSSMRCTGIGAGSSSTMMVWIAERSRSTRKSRTSDGMADESSSTRSSSPDQRIRGMQNAKLSSR